MEEMKTVEFQGFMGDLVLRSKREEREGLSEGVGFHRSCAWHSIWKCVDGEDEASWRCMDG